MSVFPIIRVRWCDWIGAAATLLASISAGQAASRENVMLDGVPDYTWYAGCFGTACGNLMGYWDRHGFPGFYTGPTAGGVAPLDNLGANVGIRSMWASKAGFDGRPASEFGHIDDYWQLYLNDDTDSYESTASDPYKAAGRKEHAPDCIGDFIGVSQKKWTNLNNECDGNIDAFSFVFWDKQGAKRANYVPRAANAEPIPDVPSGLRAWTKYRGSEASVISQLVDFNPESAGQGFTFNELKAEIDAGYPVLLFLQVHNELFRSLPGMPRANPRMHGMLAFGYYISADGDQYVRYKTSWGSSGVNTLSYWDGAPWQAGLPVRGVILFHPAPQIRSFKQISGGLILEWDGPSSVLVDLFSGTGKPANWYVVEKATQLDPPDFTPVGPATAELRMSIPGCCGDDHSGFYRVRLVSAPDSGTASE